MAKAVIVALLLAVAPPAAAAPAPARPARFLDAVDLAQPARPLPGPGDAVVVLRFHASEMAGDNRVTFFRWDDAIGAPARDADDKPFGFVAKFSFSLFGGKRDQRDVRVLIVPSGSYVLGGRTFNGTMTDSFCFGAPRFTLAPGAVAYLGDFEMFGLKKMPDREMRMAMRYGYDLDGARTMLAAAYPLLAPQLAPWTPVNGATFDCDGDEFTAYAVPEVH